MVKGVKTAGLAAITTVHVRGWAHDQVIRAAAVAAGSKDIDPFSEHTAQ